jgi:hypothetical protein
MQRALRNTIAVFGAGLSIVAVTACSGETKTEAAEFNIVEEQSFRTLSALQNANIDLEDDEIDCSAEITDDTAASGTCTGTDLDGNAILSTLEGTVDLDSATCDSSIVITQGGETIKEYPEVDCLNRMQGEQVEP